MTRLGAAITRVTTLAGRHSLRVWLMWGCGVLALAALPVALVDPAILMLVLDPELLALIVVSLAGLVRIRWRRLFAG
jgi:hypothetical protein